MTPQLIKRGMGEAKLELMAEPTLRWPPVADEPRRPLVVGDKVRDGLGMPLA
jgi:hypothetical protein